MTLSEADRDVSDWEFRVAGGLQNGERGYEILEEEAGNEGF